MGGRPGDLLQVQKTMSRWYRGKANADPCGMTNNKVAEQHNYSKTALATGTGPRTQSRIAKGSTTTSSDVGNFRIKAISPSPTSARAFTWPP